MKRAAITLLWLGGALLLACGAPQAAPQVGALTPTPPARAGATTPDAAIASATPPSAAPTPTLTPLPPVGPKPGNTAPDFTLELDTGQTVSLVSLRDQGRPVVLYFFTTW
ncbi:MAG: redoxin domain-containing protein [Chloroflexi bacterium]|nr:redoxin domain-containing protein [Chloroflexota bacterium]